MSGTAIGHAEDRSRVVVEVAEEGVLADRLVALGLDVLVDGLLVDRDQRAALVLMSSKAPPLTSDSITRLLQTSAGTLAMKSLKSVEAALRCRGLDDLVDDVGADVADRGQAEADVAADRRERRLGLVDVGREHLDLHPAALVEVDRHLVLVVLDRRQERRHVLGRVVAP